VRPDAVARRYARALFELAEEQQNVETVATALGLTADLFADPEIGRVMTSPVARVEKAGWLKEIAERASAPESFRNFLQLLDDRDRLDHVVAIRTVFDGLVDRKNGVTRATVCSAATLADDVVLDISRVFGTITGKKVEVRVELVPELIAGIIVEVDGRVYDGSLSTQLAKLHGQMAG
jgi:F-type H+-transporting ATPase subunit delta